MGKPGHDKYSLTFRIPQHIADTDERPPFLELSGNAPTSIFRATAHWFLDKQGALWERANKLQLEVVTW